MVIIVETNPKIKKYLKTIKHLYMLKYTDCFVNNDYIVKISIADWCCGNYIIFYSLKYCSKGRYEFGGAKTFIVDNLININNIITNIINIMNN